MKRLIFAVICASVTFAAEKGWKLPPETAKLRPGQGVELVTAQCLLCHSADYISTQPPVNRVAWTAAVTKMKDKYGAPIAPENVDALVNYLVKTYGSEKSPPPSR